MLRSDAPASIKTEAFFHLTSPMVYLYMTIMVLLFFPAIMVNLQPFENGTTAAIVLACSLFAMGTVSASVFYVTSQQAQGRSVWWTVSQIPMLMAVGVGIAFNNARAIGEALIGHDSPFVRTPKFGEALSETAGDEDDDRGNDGAGTKPAGWLSRLLPPRKVIYAFAELTFGAYIVLCIYLAFQQGPSIVSIPFLFIFAAGYFYVGGSSLWTYFASLTPRPAPPVPA